MTGALNSLSGDPQYDPDQSSIKTLTKMSLKAAFAMLTYESAPGHPVCPETGTTRAVVERPRWNILHCYTRHPFLIPDVDDRV